MTKQQTWLDQLAENNEVSLSMEHSDNNFILALGKAIGVATFEDAIRIRQAFPEYWNQFKEIYEEGRRRRKAGGD